MRRFSSFVSLAALSMSPACGDSTATFGGGGEGPAGGAPEGGGAAIGLPAAIDMGDADCGEDTERTLRIGNSGAVDFSYSVTSSNPEFSVSPASGTVAAGESASVTVTLTPDADVAPGDVVEADLTVTTDPATDTKTVQVKATVHGAVLKVSPNPVAIGDVAVGDTGTGQLTISNDGDTAVGLTLSAFDDPEFVFEDVAGLAVDPGQDATLFVDFTPGAEGAASATASITADGPVCGAIPAIDASANGAQVTALTITGIPVDFADVPCGSPDGTAQIVLTNHDSVDLDFALSFTVGSESPAAFSASPDSGTIAPGDMQTVTITRSAIALPVPPGAYDAVLHVHSVGSETNDRDIDVFQSLVGAFFATSFTGFDFGFAPLGVSLAASLTVDNAGTLSAVATFDVTGADFSASLPGATIGAGSASVFDAIYAPEALGPTSGTLTLSAPGACNSPSITLDAGTGSWAEISDSVIDAPCDFLPNGSLDVTNLGNQPLTLTNCQEVVAMGIDPVLPDPSTVPEGTSALISYGWSTPSPLHSGTTVATIQCDTNEKFHTTRQFLVTRNMMGADLVLTPPPGGFDFSCSGFGANLFMTVENTGNQSANYGASFTLPSPLYSLGGFGFLLPGDSDSSIGVGMGSGSCGAASGQIAIFASSSTICSITPATVPVTTTP